MRLGHWDAGFGIAGDMALGSLLDAGARLESVNAALDALGVPGLRVETRRAMRCGLDCARAWIRWDGDGLAEASDHEATGQGTPSASGHVHGGDDGDAHGAARHEHPGHPPAHAHADERHTAGDALGHHPKAGAHRAYHDIRAMLAAARLADPVRARAEAVFARLAEAEGRVHGRPAADVHFHEVGGEDAIGDIVGVAAALEDLGIGDVTVSPLPAGGGTVKAAHGLLPVPAPAVALLLQGFDWHPGPVEGELVTPTGAALLAALARPARAWPELTLEGSGWGAGRRAFPGHPNACRFVWGQPFERLQGLRSETLTEIETNIDDQTPEAIGHLYERLFAAGALDVATQPLWMKKQRPGVQLWALSRPADAERICTALLEESSALGLRTRQVRRWSLPRTSETVQTRFGTLRIKVATLDGRVINAAPEFEDCRAAAAQHHVPLKTIFAAAVAAWEARSTGAGPA